MCSRWNADIIRNKEANEYRAIIAFEDFTEVEATGNGYRELCANVELLTGIRLPRSKAFSWQKLSDWEQYAGIDASHTRPTCIVTMADRRAGWRREIF